MEDKIIQVSGFSVGPPEEWQYLIVGITESGAVVISNGNGQWASIGPKTDKMLPLQKKEN